MDSPSLGGNRGTIRPSWRCHIPVVNTHWSGNRVHRGYTLTTWEGLTALLAHPLRLVTDIWRSELLIEMSSDQQVWMADLNAILVGSTSTWEHLNRQ